jgi:hypothetical protein
VWKVFCIVFFFLSFFFMLRVFFSEWFSSHLFSLSSLSKMCRIANSSRPSPPLPIPTPLWAPQATGPSKSIRVLHQESRLRYDLRPAYGFRAEELLLFSLFIFL